MISADSNIFTYAANEDSPLYNAAMRFIQSHADDPQFAICELMLVELYMNLRNPAIFRKPLSPSKAAKHCNLLKANPSWQVVDYNHAISTDLWHWAETTNAGFRRIIDARLALTLRFHGVEQFATANVKDFKEFGFKKVWNPL